MQRVDRHPCYAEHRKHQRDTPCVSACGWTNVYRSWGWCTKLHLRKHLDVLVRHVSPFSEAIALQKTFRSTGAVAELFDISCLPKSTFDAIADLAFDTWKYAPSVITALDLVNTLAPLKPVFVLGQHYFIINPLTGSGLSPKWDFTSASEAGHADAFVVGAKTGDVPAPSDADANVDWLSLKGVEGDLASAVYRMDTRGGQPPTSVRNSPVHAHM